MADYDELTYFHLQGLFNGIIGDTTGQLGDPGPEPDLYNVNMSAQIALGFADPVTHKPVAGPPMLRITDATPPRTLLLVPVTASVESGVLRMPGADTGINGVDIVAKSPILGADDKTLLCTVTFGPATIGGNKFQFDPVTFLVPTVLPANYHANETQVVTVAGQPTGGTGALIYGQTPTVSMPINPTAAAVQAALRSIPAIGNAVTVTGGAGGVNAVQTITIDGAPGVGSFHLLVFGVLTAEIGFNSTAATVQSTLEALSMIDPGDVAVAGPVGGPYQVTFGGKYASAPIPAMVATPSAAMMGAGGSVAVVLTTAGVNVGPFTVVFDTALIPRPLRLGSLDNFTGGSGPSLKVTDSWTPVVVDLTTVERYAG